MFPRPRPRSVAVAAIACSLGAAVLAGCGGEDPDAGTNGVGRLTPKKIVAKARDSASAAETVHLAGGVTSGGRTYRLDMRLAEDGGVGEVTVRGHTIELRRIEDDLYLKADGEFYTDKDAGEKAASEETAKKLDGKYVKVAPDDPAYRQFAGFTDKNVLTEDLFVLHGKPAAGKRATVDGTKTIAVTADAGAGGTLVVSLEGRPYPLRYKRAGGAGTLDFDDWDESFPLEAPKDDEVIDYGEQIIGIE